MKPPLQIGVTGGIGSGKSVVCRVFSALGVPVYYADDRAKWLTTHDPILKADITRLLGAEAYDLSGAYNRSWVASQVFINPQLLGQLNALIHPRVWADTVAWVESHAHHAYVVKEAALMGKAGGGNLLDKVIVVTAPETLRIARIQQRDPHRSVTEIQHIMDRQLSDKERLNMSDYVLINDEQQLILPQLITLHAQFLAVAR